MQLNSCSGNQPLSTGHPELRNKLVIDCESVGEYKEGPGYKWQVCNLLCYKRHCFICKPEEFLLGTVVVCIVSLLALLLKDIE